jgi:hypothetical protein
MLGVLVFERDPYQLGDLLHLLANWVQVAGGFAAVALIFWLLFVVTGASVGGWRARRFLSRGPAQGGVPGLAQAPDPDALPRWQAWLFIGALLTAAVAYIPGLIFLGRSVVVVLSPRAHSMMEILLTVGGAASLVAIGLPFALNAARMRGGRIWALTKLSFKEGIRRKILYVFSALLLVLMFATWFIDPNKQENQVRTYVMVLDLAMGPLLLFAAVLLSAFSIPNDIRQQTIHTILTKPVERFEVVLGRFFGFTALMTLVLGVMTLIGLVYVIRGVDPDAAQESLKARDPLYGTLEFQGTANKKKGENVGREWDYRGYISGPMPGQKQPTSVTWSFPVPSRALTSKDFVRCEFSFDIYRTTKGYENRGVSCAFAFQTWKFNRGQEQEYRKRRNEELQRPDRGSERQIDNKLTEEFGYYEVPGKTVVDYHTQWIDLPAGLFRNAVPKNSAEQKELEARGVPPVQVLVKCNSSTQYVGMARYDLFLRQDEAEGGYDHLWFAINFCKGAAGLWFRLCLIIGIAVALSTYFTGVISLLIALLLYLGGLSRGFIESVGAGTNVGGGPLESVYRLATRQTMAAPLEASAGVVGGVKQGDIAFRWLIRRVLDIIPDVDRFDFSLFVSEGFNISWEQLLINFLLLAGYLLPWGILAYYLSKWREVASAN